MMKKMNKNIKKINELIEIIITASFENSQFSPKLFLP
jgi:hypothetical protein